MGRFGLILIVLFCFAVISLAEQPEMAPKTSEAQSESSPGPGFVPPSMDLSHLTGTTIPEIFRDLQPPAQWDWREQSMVTPIRDQGACNACYAFASIGNIESKMLIDSVGTFDFSENNAKECNWYQSSCNPANYYKMANWFSKMGTVLESCDPYVPNNVDCNMSCPYVITLVDWRIISANSVPSTAVLKDYIYTYGPAYVALYSGDNNDPSWRNEFSNYDGSYTLYYTGSWTTNHAVLIVGWDDTLSHAGGSGAWIAKNSWGTDWGGPCGYGSENGYFTIAYGSASIGKWSSYLYDWQNYDSLGGVMYWDEGGWTYNWGYQDQTAWGLCKFDTWGPIKVMAVEFWTNDVTTDIDVYVYDDFDGSNLSNLLATDLNNDFEEAGYHSIALDPAVEIQWWNDYYVVVKFTNSSYGYPIPVDDQGPYVTGKTYISHYGNPGTWFDMGGNEVDIGIRARVRSLVGACCDESDWTCTENVFEIDCWPPLRWQEGVTCDEMEPPCAEPIMGACCVGEDCVATETEAECESRPGTWYEGETCPEFDCPAGCDYVVGDVNGSDSYNGLDITYGVAYLKGGNPPMCDSCALCPGWYYCGDVNGSCNYNGLDITYGVAYLKGGPALIPCADCPPIQ